MNPFIRTTQRKVEFLIETAVINMSYDFYIDLINFLWIIRSQLRKYHLYRQKRFPYKKTTACSGSIAGDQYNIELVYTNKYLKASVPNTHTWRDWVTKNSSELSRKFAAFEKHLSKKRNGSVSEQMYSRKLFRGWNALQRTHLDLPANWLGPLFHPSFSNAVDHQLQLDKYLGNPNRTLSTKNRKIW